MDLPGQERRGVVVVEVQDHVAAHDRSGKPGAAGWMSIHFDLQAEDLVAVRREPHLMENSVKTDPGILDGPLRGELGVELVTFPAEFRLDGVSILRQIVGPRASFQREVKVLGVPRQAVEKA